MRSSRARGRTCEILLVEDNPADVRLTMEAFREDHLPIHLNAVADGIEALAFLRREGQYADAPCPDLILLDLNVPKKSGHEVLAELKMDPDLRRIPVVILTTSDSPHDIAKSYDLHANCFVKKPARLEELLEVVKALDAFWFGVVRLPERTPRG